MGRITNPNPWVPLIWDMRGFFVRGEAVVFKAWKNPKTPRLPKRFLERSLRAGVGRLPFRCYYRFLSVGVYSSRVCILYVRSLCDEGGVTGTRDWAWLV